MTYNNIINYISRKLICSSFHNCINWFITQIIKRKSENSRKNKSAETILKATYCSNVTSAPILPLYFLLMFYHLYIKV